MKIGPYEFGIGGAGRLPDKGIFVAGRRRPDAFELLLRRDVEVSPVEVQHAATW